MAVDRTLPGLSRVEQLRHLRQGPGGSRQVRLWFPSCGGVTIDIPVGERNGIRDSRLLKVKELVMQARPSPQAVTWQFPDPLPWR